MKRKQNDNKGHATPQKEVALNKKHKDMLGLLLQKTPDHLRAEVSALFERTPKHLREELLHTPIYKPISGKWTPLPWQCPRCEMSRSAQHLHTDEQPIEVPDTTRQHSEMAAAVAISGLERPPAIGSNMQVRTVVHYRGPNKRHSLIVRSEDADDHLFTLVIALGGPEFGVVGWIEGWRAKQIRGLESPQGSRPAFFVDPRGLYPPEDLRQAIARHDAGTAKLVAEAEQIKAAATNEIREAGAST